MSYALAYSPYNTNLFMRGRNSAVYLAAELKDRVIADGGTFEAESCLINQLTNLSEIYVDEESLPFAEYLAATGITGPTEVVAIYNLMAGLQQDGLWSKMKAVYPFVTDNRNLAGYSEDITNITGWNSVTMTRTANTTVAPNGTLTADTFTTVSNGNNAVWNLGWIAGNGQTFTNSIYLKYNNAQWVTLEIWEGSGQNGIRLWVDIQNGVLGTANATVGTYLTSSILSVGNGWYRVSLTGIMPGVNNAILVVRHVDGNGAYNFTAVSGLSTYCWGAQNEIGTLTAYQPIATSQQAYIASQFKYNLKDPRDLDAAFRLVFNGGWTHSSNGALPNGTNGWANTYLQPSSVLSQNSTHLSFYSRSNILNTLQFEIGSFTLPTGLGSSSFGISYNFAPNGHFRNRISTATPSTGFIPTDARGLFVSNRTTSTQQKAYQNGVLKETANVNSDGLSILEIAIAANRTAASGGFMVGDYSAKQTAFASIGDGLTDTEAANLYTRVQAFQTSLSRQV